MTEARKAPTRHPSTLIPTETVEEIAYRVYLRRLEPSMSPAESRATSRTDAVTGKVTASDTIRRKNSESFQPLTREFLRVLVDMGMIKVEEPPV